MKHDISTAISLTLIIPFQNVAAEVLNNFFSEDSIRHFKQVVFQDHVQEMSNPISWKNFLNFLSAKFSHAVLLNVSTCSLKHRHIHNLNQHCKILRKACWNMFPLVNRT